MTTRRTMLLGSAALLALPAPVLAHRVNRTETTVEFSGEDGKVAVTHIFHAADVQDALYAAGLIDRPDIGSLRARAKLALYTAEHFDILINEESRPLELVGAELVGNSVYVYQEGTGFYPGELWIRATMLHDLVHHQRNSVTVKMATGSKTVTLTKATPMKDIVVEQSKP